MGNIPFGRFSATKPQTPNPVILHQFVAAWAYYFWRKIQPFFRDQNFAHVRTHATEISQLKLMWNLVFLCISKSKPFNPYPVILYKIVGSPPPHLCQKIRLRHCGRIGRRWHQVAIHASVNPPTKINGKYCFWPILCNQAPNTQPCYIASVCGSLSLLLPCYQLSQATNYRHQKIKRSYFSNGHIFWKLFVVYLFHSLWKLFHLIC